MKNEKIIDAWNKIKSSDETKQQIFNEITQKRIKNKKQPILRPKLKPLLATAIIIVMLTTTAFTVAPLVLKMLGSDIAFFNSDKQTRYSADQELIKQYSSKVDITSEKDGFSFTVDNIAFDGTFMNVFYTIKSDEVNLYEEIVEQMKEWRETTSYYVQNAIVVNRIELEVVGYTLLHDSNTYVTSDGYFASDYELKGVRRYIITDDMPDVFDINVVYHQYNNRLDIWHKYWNDGYDMPVPISISLTVDMSESKVEKLVVNPALSATVIQPKSTRFSDEYEVDDEYRNKLLAGDFDEDELKDVDIDNIDFTLKELPDTVEHNIIIDRVSISPLGNILVFTEKGADNPVNREMFSRYFILDDKGNHYRRYEDIATRREWEKDETTLIEFFGDVPSDIQYLKLIPYKLNYYYTESNLPEIQEADLNNLPQSLKQSDYGNIIIDSYTVTDDEFIFTYRYDGIVSELTARPILTVIDGEQPLVGKRGYTSTRWIYDRHTNSYTLVYTFPNPIENLKDIIKGIEIHPLNIELMEEQTVIIPLR